MALEIKYILEGGGWAECVVTKDGKSATITASYLSDALGDLANAVLEILTIEHLSKAYFEEEPGEFRWVFEWAEKDIKVIVGEYKDNENYKRLTIYNDEYFYTPLFECTCAPSELLAAMVKCLNQVFNKHGLIKYRKNWMKDDFPLDTFKKLSEIADSNREIKKSSLDAMNRYRKWKGNKDDPFAFAHESLQQNTDKEEALEVIEQALKMEIVASGWIICDEKSYPDVGLWRKAWAYQIAAMVYLWNGLYDKAFELEKYFLYREFRENYNSLIDDYLVLLITYNQAAHLKELFSDTLFKKSFVFAWEAYILIFVNDKAGYFTETRSLINKVKRARTLYFGEV